MAVRTRVLVGLLALVAGWLVGAMAVFLWPAGDRLVQVGTFEDLQAAGVTYHADPPLFVVSDGAGFVALSAMAPHRPAEQVLWCPSAGGFMSPSHGEMFSRLGRYEGGPATRDLDRYRVVVDEDEQVQVDVAEPIVAGGRGEWEGAPFPVGPFCGGGDPFSGPEPGFWAEP